MNILTIVIRTNTGMFAFDKTYQSLEQTKSSLDGLQSIYFHLETSTGRRLVVDFGKLCQQVAIICSCQTWEQIETHLGTVFLTDYIVNWPVPGQVFTKDVEGKIVIKQVEAVRAGNHPVIYYAENSDRMSISYGKAINPDYDNIKPIRWQLPDVIFTKVDPTLQLQNCLPIVNGMVHRPTIIDNRLHARHATKAVSIDGTKGLMLVDFTPVGGIEVVGFNECELHHDNQNLDILLPESIDLVDKVALLVVHGRLMLPGDYTIISRRRISYPTYLTNFAKLDMSSSMNRRYNNYNTMIHTVDRISDFDLYNIDDIETWITESLANQTISAKEVDGIFHNYYDSFIVLINNPSVQVNTIDPVVHGVRNLLLAPKGADGLLMRLSTRELVEFVKMDYQSMTTFSINHPGFRKILPMDNPDHEDLALGYSFILPKRYDIGDDLGSLDHVLLDITTS